MKPWLHARNSVKRFGGVPEDYIRIHNFFDESKAHVADMRHRAIHHHSYGIFLAEKLFGHPDRALQETAKKFNWTEEEIQAVKGLIDKSRTDEACTIVNSSGTRVSVRDIGEQHILEDLGKIPSIQDYFNNMTLQPWMGGVPWDKRAKTQTIKLSDLKEVEID